MCLFIYKVIDTFLTGKEPLSRIHLNHLTQCLACRKLLKEAHMTYSITPFNISEQEDSWLLPFNLFSL